MSQLIKFEAGGKELMNVIRGKRGIEVLPGIEESNFDWIQTFGQVGLTGESCQAEHYSDHSNAHQY